MHELIMTKSNVLMGQVKDEKGKISVPGNQVYNLNIPTSRSETVLGKVSSQKV